MTERLQRHSKNVTSLPQKHIKICSYHRILKSEFKNMNVFQEKKIKILKKETAVQFTL